ncbi:hypothetical protein BC332_10374 [Capsicum chinense]|nr:hypothetical protein BC332_10374 [Capsicum chinense]
MVGSLPPEIGNLKAITVMDLSMNQLSNEIPREIGGLQNLVYLSLRHNKLQGAIPDSMSNMPSNVLLDEDMVAHLSDFGISKFLGEDESDLYTKTLATLGYIAPEYGQDGLVSTKCDVYSYGIMLLETFTRRKPNNFEGDLSFEAMGESFTLRVCNGRHRYPLGNTNG